MPTDWPSQRKQRNAWGTRRSGSKRTPGHPSERKQATIDLRSVLENEGGFVLEEDQDSGDCGIFGERGRFSWVRGAPARGNILVGLAREIFSRAGAPAARGGGGRDKLNNRSSGDEDGSGGTDAVTAGGAKRRRRGTG